MTSADVELGGAALSCARFDALLGRSVRVSIAPGALQRTARGRSWVEHLARGAAPVYGINTGFGHLKNVRIPPAQLDLLQENLLISHAVGVGPPAPLEIVRWMLALKIHMLLAGHSGVRPEVVTRLADWLNADVLPRVPTRGSLGASGDLAPLAHLVLPLIGRGEMLRTAEFGAAAQQRMACGDSHLLHFPQARPAAEALAAHGWEPLSLASKEGLALINGTQFMCAYAAHIGVRARRLLDLADLIACISLEGLAGSVRPMDERLHRLRPHAGLLTTAANIRRNMHGSQILASHADCDRVQDPYSLRCIPQVHGAVRGAIEHLCAVVDCEMNSVTDNPVLVEAAERAGGPAEAISGGSFHGAPLALVLEYAGVALTDLASISERRTYLLLGGTDGLPKLLLRDTGVNSGLMIAQYTAAALLNECKVLAAPAAVDTIPTSLGQEDHVSMGATSALKCWEILDRAEHVLAIELLCATQALDFRAPLLPGEGPRAAHALVRTRIAHADRDREFGVDIRAALGLLRGDPLLAVARGPQYG